MAVCQNLKHKLMHDPSVSLQGKYIRGLKAGGETDTCTPVFIAALLTLARRWKQPKCPWIDELYYSALKTTENQTHATTHISFKVILLSEITWSQKNRYMIPLL